MRLRTPSPSMVVSIAALVIAMGGTSYAAVQINGKDIKSKSITSMQIKKDSLASGVIADGTLAKKDFKPGALATPSRWAYIDATGAIAAQSGGFTLVAGYPTLAPTATDPQGARASGNVYLNANEDLSDNGIVATLTLQNTIEQDANANTNGRATGSDQNAEFSGEVTVSRCAFPGSAGIPTNCAPTGAQNATSFVVSPRLSDGSVTTKGTNSKGFYVVITGDSSDYVKPAA